jgi:hypothetical protein
VVSRGYDPERNRYELAVERYGIVWGEYDDDWVRYESERNAAASVRSGIDAFGGTGTRDSPISM